MIAIRSPESSVGVREYGLPHIMVAAEEFARSKLPLRGESWRALVGNEVLTKTVNAIRRRSELRMCKAMKLFEFDYPYSKTEDEERSLRSYMLLYEHPEVAGFTCNFTNLLNVLD